MKGSQTEPRANSNQTARLSILGRFPSPPSPTVQVFWFTDAVMPQKFRMPIQRPPDTRPVALAQEERGFDRASFPSRSWVTRKHDNLISLVA